MLTGEFLDCEDKVDGCCFQANLSLRHFSIKDLSRGAEDKGPALRTSSSKITTPAGYPRMQCKAKLKKENNPGKGMKICNL